MSLLSRLQQKRHHWKCDECGASGSVLMYKDGTVDKGPSVIEDHERKRKPCCPVRQNSTEWRFQIVEGETILWYEGVPA